MLRVSFSSVSKASAAVDAFAAYGYSAERHGRQVVTDCPPLLAIPAIQKQVGFGDIERLDLNTRVESRDPTTERSADGGEAPKRASEGRRGDLRA